MEMSEEKPRRLGPEICFSQTPLSTTALSNFSRLHRCFRQGRRFFPKLARVLCPHPLSSNPVSSPFLSPPTHLPQNPSRGWTVSGSSISWAICKSAPCSRQITTPALHHSVFTGRMPFLPPNQQRQSTEAMNHTHHSYSYCCA